MAVRLIGKEIAKLSEQKFVPRDRTSTHNLVIVKVRLTPHIAALSTLRENESSFKGICGIVELGPSH